MKVLVACEYSDTVSAAFRKRGHDVTSCDLLPSEGDGKHIQGDVRPLLREPWDLVIAHPPCNRLSNLNNVFRNWEKVPHFWKEFEEAIAFFMQCRYANAPAVAVENPRPMPKARAILGKPSDIVSPHEFGSNLSKATWLWTTGLPPLMKTYLHPNPSPLVKIRGFDGNGNSRQGHGRNGHDRSRFHPGMAAAMAKQWGSPSPP